MFDTDLRIGHSYMRRQPERPNGIDCQCDEKVEFQLYTGQYGD